MIGSLPVGEAVVRTASISRPVRVRINDPSKVYPELVKGGPVTDEEIVEYMAPVFAKNPHFSAQPDFLPKNISLKDLTVDNRPPMIDLKEVVKLYAIYHLSEFSGILKGIQGATYNGSHLLVALIIRNIARLVSEDESSLSFWCQHLVWSISRRRDIVSEDDMELIVETLRQFVDTDEPSCIRWNHLHHRIRLEGISRARRYKINKSNLANELKEAVSRAIKERDGLSDVKMESIGTDEDLTELELKLLALVHTEQFTNRYPERVQSATDGDIGPLVDMVITFAKSLGITDVDLSVVATHLLNHARTSLDSPDDDRLWIEVHDTLLSKIDDSGSEVAV
jgi:hypothetical protein